MQLLERWMNGITRWQTQCDSCGGILHSVRRFRTALQ